MDTLCEVAHSFLEGRSLEPTKDFTMSTPDSPDIAVALYDQHTQAENAVKALQRAGFDMKKISIIGKDYESEEHVIGFLNAGDRAKILGKYGAFWGGLMGVLFGSALMFIPILGHIVILGPLAATLFSGLQGAVVVGGVSALAGALMSIGIPKDSVLRYETALRANKYLLMLHGDNQEISRAQEVLKTSWLSSFEHHPAQSKEPIAAHA
jgi:uncharacterized membrane protein